MLYTHFTEEILGLQGVKVNKVENIENNVIIHIELERKEHKCPCCGGATDKIHDYRKQVIKDIPAFGKLTTLVLRKRRYRCEHCGKRFFERNNFLPRFHRMTNRLSAYVINKLQTECSFTNVAREVNLSVTTVIRIFDLVSYPKSSLPEVISMDEFKGNAGGEKYLNIIADPANGVVLDILPSRHLTDLYNYFKAFPREERQKVKYFISDMWKPYADVASTWFKNATQIVDKYHWIRQVFWAFENVRKEEQKKLDKTLRKYFKKSRYLLLKRFDELNDENKQRVNLMLYYSPTLSRAHWFKESFLKILDCEDSKKARIAMREWIFDAEESELTQFVKCANTIRNWYKGILNSFDTKYTNGFIEGCNNKIKVLKRNAYGYRNFRRFRNRILHIFAYKKHSIKQAAACTAAA